MTSGVYTPDEHRLAHSYVDHLITKLTIDGYFYTIPDPEIGQLGNMEAELIKSDQSIDHKVDRNMSTLDPEIQHFYQNNDEFRIEIDKEESITPAILRMTNRIFRSPNYDSSKTSFTHSSEPPSPSYECTNS